MFVRLVNIWTHFRTLTASWAIILSQRTGTIHYVDVISTPPLIAIWTWRLLNSTFDKDSDKISSACLGVSINTPPVLLLKSWNPFRDIRGTRLHSGYTGREYWYKYLIGHVITLNSRICKVLVISILWPSWRCGNLPTITSALETSCRVGERLRQRISGIIS